MRNHGDSPHAAGMRYPAQAADVQETLPRTRRRTGRRGRAFHGRQGGHGAGSDRARDGRAAPGVGHRARRSTSTATPASPQPCRPITLTADPDRARQADAALTSRRAAAGRRGPSCCRTCALAPPPVAHRAGRNRRRHPGPGGLDDLPGTYDGPALFVSGANSDVHAAGAPADDQSTVPGRPLCYREKCRTLGARRQSRWLFGGSGGIPAQLALTAPTRGILMTLLRSMAETQVPARFSLVSGRLTAYLCAAPFPQS